MMRMNLKVYGQMCLKCHEWGSGSIIEPDMFNLAQLYGIIIENALHNNKNPEIPIKLSRQEEYGSAPNSKGRNKEVRM
jgi:hypothetical protein